MKPNHASQRLFAPEGFSGWWCERCVKPVTLDEELGSPARCPKCHKPTAVWIPEQASAECEVWDVERRRPASERAKQWFALMHERLENPALPADLDEYEFQQMIR